MMLAKGVVTKVTALFCALTEISDFAVRAIQGHLTSLPVGQSEFSDIGLYILWDDTPP